MSQQAADKHDQQAAEHLAQARQLEETEAWMRSDPAVQAWLTQFQANGRFFTEQYCREKNNWLGLGASWLRMERAAEHRLRADAYARLWEIQQKKLFNLHCAWRAGQVELPGIAVEADFDDWGHNIHDCRLVAAISPDELDLYLAYLRSDDCRDAGQSGRGFGQRNWQQYDGFRRYLRAEETGEEDALGGWFGAISGLVCPYPDWYAYYDQYRGTGFYISLPDVRGPGPHRLPKELRLRDPELAAHLDARNAAKANGEPPAPPALSAAPAVPARPAPLPRLAAHDLALTEKLFKRFESPEMLHFMRSCEYQDPETDNLTELAGEAMENMRYIRTPTPIRASPDWRQAVRRAGHDQRKHRLAELLPELYAAYCQREAAGQSHPAQLPPSGE